MFYEQGYCMLLGLSHTSLLAFGEVSVLWTLEVLTQRNWSGYTSEDEKVTVYAILRIVFGDLCVTRHLYFIYQQIIETDLQYCLFMFVFICYHERSWHFFMGNLSSQLP